MAPRKGPKKTIFCSLGAVLCFLLVLCFPTKTSACDFLELHSNVLGIAEFRQLRQDDELYDSRVGSGRPIYRSEVPIRGETHYLYHIHNTTSGDGQWVIHSTVTLKFEGIAYSSSWAVLPSMIGCTREPTSAVKWRVQNHGNWVVDNDLKIYCKDALTTRIGDKLHIREMNKAAAAATSPCDAGPHAIFFHAPFTSPSINGVYIRRFRNQIVNDSSTIDPKTKEEIYYQQITPYGSSSPYFIYRRHAPDVPTGHTQWLLSERLGHENAISFVVTTKPSIDAVVHGWHFHESNRTEWSEDHSARIISVLNTPTAAHLLDAVWKVRNERVSNLGTGNSPQTLLTLRHGVSIPQTGLGTGGIPPEHMKRVMSSAVDLGYRLFDLAREYHNEAVLGDIISTLPTEDEIYRENFFITTKLWPTDLGFKPTLNAVASSLQQIGTSYIDLYMLHWPACDPLISWMRCHEKIESSSTWIESWRALERLFAEGTLQSIGVSNFDKPLLTSLQSVADVLPHVVQNWADISRRDTAVRHWCAHYAAVYQPYASLRHLHKSESAEKELLNYLSKRHSTNDYQVMLQFFRQTGACVIPRSTTISHLRNNIAETTWKLSDEEIRAFGWIDAATAALASKATHRTEL